MTFRSSIPDHPPFFPPALTKGPFDGYLCSIDSKAPGADVRIGRMIERPGTIRWSAVSTQRLSYVDSV